METIGQPPMSRKLERPGARWKGKAVGCDGRGIDAGGRIVLAGSELAITYKQRKKAGEALLGGQGGLFHEEGTTRRVTRELKK